MPLPVLDPPEPPLVKSRFGRRSLWGSLAPTVFRLLFFASLAALIWTGWYLANRGFGRQWRLRVVEELHKRGVEASVRRLTLDPFRGLIAQDVRIFDYQNRENTIAEISEVALDINYAALLHHQPFLNALDVRNAQLLFTVPTADANAPKARVTNFRAHVYFPPQQIFVTQAEGIFCGVRISATGQLMKADDYQPAGEMTDAEWRARMTMIQRVVTELGSFNFSGGPPSLQIKFTGDLAHPETTRIDAALRGDRMQRGAYVFNELLANAEWADQTLSITQCQWRDGAGNVSARASWSSVKNLADFQAHSTLDLKGFLDAFGFTAPLRDAAFTSAPVLELSGSFDLRGEAPRVSVIGRVAVENFSYKAVPILGLSADFSWDGERGMLREVHVRHRSGELTGDVLDAPNDFRLNLESSIDPTALRAFFPPDFQQFLSEWEWQKPPAIYLSIRGPSHDPAAWSGNGTLTLQRTRFRGVWMNSASSAIRFANAAVTLENFRIARDEGVGTGSCSYDFAKHEIRVTNIKSSLRPTDAIFWVDPKLLKAVMPYKFRQQPNVTANGVIRLHGGKGDHLELTVDAPGGMDYVFIGKTLPIEHVSGRLLFTDDRLQLSDVQGTIFGGALAGAADISLAKHEIRVTNIKSTLRPTDAIFWVDPKLLKAVMPYKFRQQPSVTANGVIRLHGGKGDHLELTVDAPGGMDYLFVGKTLPIEHVSGRLLFTDDRLQLSDVQGTIFGGALAGAADISLARHDPHYHAVLSVADIDFPRLTDLYFKYETAHGRLSGSYDFTGLGDEARTMRGSGKIQVANGDVFAIPVFGPLSGLLGAIIPGAGYSVAHQANATFTIAEGVIHTNDFKVSGKLFGMLGHGDIRFLDDKLDFDIRINGGGVGVLLTPMYKLFEYHGEGSFSKPVWRPKRF